MKPNRKNPILLSALAAVLITQSAQAVTLYWDGNNGTSGFGSASDTWAAPTTGTATSGWSTSSTGATAISGNSVTTAAADVLNFGTDAATFGLGGGTITVSGTVQATQLRFGSQTTSNVTLSGGTINFAAAGNIHVGAGGTTNHNVSSSITGAGTSLTKTGNILTLSGSNSYTGTTIISTGNLVLNNLSALGSTSGINIGGAASATLSSSLTGITITAPITTANTGINSTISFSRATSAVGSITLDGAIGGNGNVIFTTPNVSSGGNVQTINLGSASNNYAGNTTLGTGNSGNSLTLSNSSGAANALPTTTVFTFAQNNGSGSGRTTTFNLNGQNQTLAGLSNGGVVPENRNMTVTSGTAATLTINSTANHTFGGRTISTVQTTVGVNTRAQISGAISLVKNGTGTFTLGGTLSGGAVAGGNAFTGSTTVLGGILVLGETQSIQNSAFDTTSVLGDATNGLRAGIGGTGVTTLTLGGLIGGNDFSSRFTSTTGGYTNLTNLTLNPGTGATPSYSGDVGNGNGSMTLTKAGAGTQTLTVAQTYSGGTNINAGILALSGTGTLGASGTALTLGGGALDLGTTGQTVGAVSVTAAAASGDTISNGSLTGTSYAASNTTGTAIITANLLVNGGAGFSKTGAGTVTLSGTNTYTGNTTITAGVLGTALPTNLAGYTDSGKVVFDGGRLNIATGDGSTTGWTAAQVATLLSNATKTSGTLGITVDNGDVTETAFDFGGLTLVKSGESTLTLNQAHTLGATTIVGGGGILEITDAAALGAGAVTIQTSGTNTGTLELALSGTNSITNTFNGFNSANALSGGGNAQILNTSGTNTITSDLTVTNTGGNGLNVVSDGGLITLSGTITHTIASGRTLSLGGSGNGVVSGAINNNSTGDVTLGLSKTGTGTWTLSSASSTYTGATNINGGSLIINGAVASTSVVVNASLGGSGSASAATLSGSGAVNPGNSPGIFTASAANPTGGLDFNFEFTAEGTDPTWSNATASVNDVLRLTNATPFTAALAGTNTVSIYLNVASIAENDVFTGGFYTDNNAAFLASISGADFQYYIADPSGTDYNGVLYSLYTGSLDFNVNTIQVASADFAGGTITNGYVTQFTVIPEPNVAALIGALGGILLLRRRR